MAALYLSSPGDDMLGKVRLDLVTKESLHSVTQDRILKAEKGAFN